MHSQERVRDALWCLDPSVEREQWVRILMAAKAAGADLDTVDAWSAQSGNYAGSKDVAAVWRSISSDGKVTDATLFHMAKAAGGMRNNGAARMSNIMPIRAQQARQVPQKARDAAQAAWNGGEAVPLDHEYLIRKRLLPDGLRVYRGSMVIKDTPVDGMIMMPGFVDGELRTLQFVGSKAKLHFPGLAVEGFYSLGQLDGDVYLAEGLGAAHSCHQATGRGAVASFGAGNTARAAMWIISQGAKPIIVADQGKQHQAAEIAREMDCKWIEMPPDSAQNYDINDMHCAADLGAVARYLAMAVRQHPRKYSLLPAASLLALPPVRWRVKHLLPEIGIGLIAGQSGAGKSFAALELALRIARGEEFFGYRCLRAPVLYLALEGAGGFGRRLRAWMHEFGELPDNVHFLIRSSFDIRNPTDRAELVRAAQDIGFTGGVILIDTMAQSALGMEENSSEGMGEVIAGMTSLQDSTSSLVLAVHHLGKDADRGPRGHSSLFAACDCVMTVSKAGEDHSWKIAKNKDGRDSVEHGFELAEVQIGEDYDGEAVTSCVIRGTETAPKAPKAPKQGFGGHQKIAYDAIRCMLDDSSQMGRDGAPITRPCVSLDSAINAVKIKLVCDAKHRASRARDAINGLIARRIFDANELWVWSIEK